MHMRCNTQHEPTQTCSSPIFGNSELSPFTETRCVSVRTSLPTWRLGDALSARGVSVLLLAARNLAWARVSLWRVARKYGDFRPQGC